MIERSILFFYNLKKFFRVNKKFLLLILSLIFIFFFFGYGQCIRNNCYNVYQIKNTFLKLFSLGKINFFWYFLLTLLLYSILLFLISFLSTIKVLRILVYFVLAKLSYDIGYDLCVLSNLFSNIESFIFIILCYLIWQLFINFIIYIYSFKIIFEFKEISYYGKSFFNGKGINLFLLTCLVFLITIFSHSLLFFLFKFLIFC